jgi:hypothetical protein
MTYFFLLTDFADNESKDFCVDDKVEDFCVDEYFSTILILLSVLIPSDLGMDIGFILDNDGFSSGSFFSWATSSSALITGVSFADVIKISFTEFSSWTVGSIGPANDIDGDDDGDASVVNSIISLALIKSSELRIFDVRWSVGKGSPGSTPREPIVNQTNNKKGYEINLFSFTLQNDGKNSQ